MANGQVNQNNSKVYYGPSASLFSIMESLPQGKPLELLWREGSSWFYVEYALSDGVKRRGYIMSSNVNILSGSVDPRSITRSNRYVIHAAPVFTGPQPGDYLSAGSVELGALVQYLNYKINGYALIEYSVSSTQRKRAYINANNLSGSYAGLLSNFCNIAEGEIGEQDPADNDMTKYGEWYGANGVSWCAIFVSWCAAQAGILTEAQSAPVPRVKKEAAVSTMRNWYSNNNRLVSASSSADIRTGDLAFFNSHVGIVVGVSGNTINLVEGNCGKYVRKYAYTNFNGPSGTILYFGSNHD